ncbi:MAG: hypothetical protein HXY37_02310 [Chloroflexi bacterium]|nr:hypothetical protein [Chloroflexota bacterium]
MTSSITRWQLRVQGMLAPIWRQPAGWFTRHGTALVSGLARLGEARLGMEALPAQPPQDAPHQAYESQVLRQAVYTNSPYALDWLVYASIMTDPAKRRYCLERALALDPTSEPTQEALRRLHTTQ